MQARKYRFPTIATAFAVAMFFWGCEDTYQRVGEEKAAPVYPQGIAEDFTLTYTETLEELQSEGQSGSRIIAVLQSERSEDYENLRFPHRIFPEGLYLEFFDERGQKSTIRADYAIIYSRANLIDLQGHVVLQTHDGKKLETTQLYWDRSLDWIFTQARFTFTNPEEGTVLNGEGMDFNRDFTYFNAHKTGGEMRVKEETS